MSDESPRGRRLALVWLVGWLLCIGVAAVVVGVARGPVGAIAAVFGFMAAFPIVSLCYGLIISGGRGGWRKRMGKSFEEAPSEKRRRYVIGLVLVPLLLTLVLTLVVGLAPAPGLALVVVVVLLAVLFVVAAVRKGPSRGGQSSPE